VEPRRCIAVAWSGGRDSTALLHATLVAARPLGVQVAALHVHHGLSRHADEWLAHCEQQAARWAASGHPIVLRHDRLRGRPARGESVEAWARRGRYQALRRLALAEGARVVLLAQHRRDQAETVLLQALRGAGTGGLAAMPAQIERDGLVWSRPWLAWSSDAVAAYARRHRLAHIEDDSNSDPRYARNRLRLQVWPALSAAFPDAEAVLADTAGWAQQASACLAELATLDLAGAASDASGGLAIPALAALSPARRANALRHWLHGQLGRAAPATLIERLVDELAGPAGRRWPVEGGSLHVHRGRLRYVAGRASTGEATAARETALSVTRAGRYKLPGWGGTLQVERVRTGGVPFAWLAQLDLRERSGGERFQAGLGRPPRSLKKQFQMLGVPAWERAAPLVWSGGQLVFVPGLGLDARVIGLPGQPQARLHWRAGTGPSGAEAPAG